jgi:siroheme synthase (precorrin-2 oxidase/ferrochelatase)
VSTGGRSPALAREIRRRLEPLFADDYAELVERVPGKGGTMGEACHSHGQ